MGEQTYKLTRNCPKINLDVLPPNTLKYFSTHDLQSSSTSPSVLNLNFTLFVSLLA